MNKSLLTFFALLIVTALSAIASPQSESFASTGFSKDNVTGCIFKRAPLDDGAMPNMNSSKDFLGAIVDVMSNINPPKTKSVDFVFKMSLIANFSGTASEIKIFVDAKGNGYFQKSDQSAIYFYSPTLFAFLSKTEQGAAANP